MNSTALTTRLLPAAMLSLLAATGHAEPLHPALTDTHTVGLGVFEQNADTKVGASIKGGRSAELDLDDLGVSDSDTSFNLGYRWRFGERWSLAANYGTYSAGGDKTLSRTFEFDGVEFDAGLELKSSLDLDVLLVDVLYSVYRSDRAEIQLGGGVHAFKYDISFKARAFVGDTSQAAASAADDLLAPLPNLRVHGIYALNSRWALEGSLGWLSANVDDWDGDYLFANVMANYRFGDHFGAGLGYRMVDFDVTHSGKRTESTLNINYQGPALILQYAF